MATFDIERVEMSPQTPNVGETVTFTVFITNTSTFGADDTLVSVADDNYNVIESKNISIYSGNTRELDFQLSFDNPGETTLIFLGPEIPTDEVVTFTVEDTSGGGGSTGISVSEMMVNVGSDVVSWSFTATNNFSTQYDVTFSITATADGSTIQDTVTNTVTMSPGESKNVMGDFAHGQSGGTNIEVCADVATIG